MRKNYTFGILFLFFLNCFSSFGQAPFANNYNYYRQYNCNFGSSSEIFLNGITSANGIDFTTVDLLPDVPGVQTSLYSNGISYSYSGGYYINISIDNPYAYGQIQYTFKDNLGNLSNVGTISVIVLLPYISHSMINGVVTCDNPNSGQINFSTGQLSPPYTFKLYRSSGSGPLLYSTDTITDYSGIVIKSNLPYGVYSFVATMSCGIQINSQDDYQRTIRQANPLTGIATATYSDYNGSGVVDVGDVLNYQFTITNTSSTCVMQNVGLSYSFSVIPIPSIAPGGSAILYATKSLTQTDINNGSVTIYDKVSSTSLLSSNYSYDSNITLTTPLNISSAIKLNAFIDINNNGIQDGLEPDYTNGTFSYQINSGYVHNLYTSLGELYLYETNPSNVYNLSYNISSNNSFCGAQYIVATTSYPNVTVANGSGITTYNFPITTVPCTDVSVNLIQNSSPRLGFEYQNLIKYKNDGNQVASGTITYSKDNLVSITSTSPFIATNSGGFVYNYTNLQPGETRTISVNMLVPTIPTVSLGQLLTNSVSITPTEANMSNNSTTLFQSIVGSYDPNDKTESHGGKILHSSFTASDYLNYTIRFENTGTAEAINIKVEDVLDSKLDETSIRMIASSHPYVLDRVGSNLKWNFNGVNLPPSVPNTQTGHGYIVFQVKPKPGFAIGDVIPNTANIYFDFNPAIVTNTCTTEFVSTLSNEKFTFNNFKSFPNPVKNSLTISNASPIETIEISSILGQKMLSKKVNDIQTEIDLSQLSNGIYFVKVTCQGNEKTIKIVKE